MISPHAQSVLSRVARMVAAGHEPEARWYVRRLAVGTLRYARNLSRADGVGAKQSREKAAQLRADGAAFACEARRLRGTPELAAGIFDAGGSADVRSYHRPVDNVRWPGITDGVLVAFEHRPGRGYGLDVQILSPDAVRSQFCFWARMHSREHAERVARIWIAVGNAVVDADLPARGTSCLPTGEEPSR